MNKLDAKKIISNAGLKYQALNAAEHFLTDNIVEPKIKSNQVRAAIYVLVEEINKILDNKKEVE